MVVEVLVHTIVWILVFGPAEDTKWWKSGGEGEACSTHGWKQIEPTGHFKGHLATIRDLPLGLASQSLLHHLQKAPRERQQS